MRLKQKITFTRDESGELGIKYLKKIGSIYKNEFNFRLHIRIKSALFFGGHVDILLLLIGLLKEIYFIPIITILFGGYSFCLNTFYRNKLYGYRY